MDDSKGKQDEAQGGDGASRGRPGRRTAEDREKAVLDLLSGKASVDQIARRYGVQPATVEGWRDEAIAALGAAMRRGSAKSPKERELEKKLGTLEKAFTDLAIRHEVLQKALSSRPSRPGRSSK